VVKYGVNIEVTTVIKLCHGNKGRPQNILFAWFHWIGHLRKTLGRPKHLSVYLPYKPTYRRFCAKIAQMSLPWQQGSASQHFARFHWIGHPRKPTVRPKHLRLTDFVQFWALGGLNQKQHMENWWPKNGSIPSRNNKEEAIWRSVTDRQRDIRTDRQSQLLTIMTPRLGAEINILLTDWLAAANRTRVLTCDYRWWHRRRRSLADTHSRMMSAYCDTRRPRDSCVATTDTRQCRDTWRTTRQTLNQLRLSERTTSDVNSSHLNLDLTQTTSQPHSLAQQWHYLPISIQHSHHSFIPGSTHSPFTNPSLNRSPLPSGLT